MYFLDRGCVRTLRHLYGYVSLLILKPLESNVCSFSIILIGWILLQRLFVMAMRNVPSLYISVFFVSVVFSPLCPCVYLCTTSTINKHVRAQRSSKKSFLLIKGPAMRRTQYSTMSDIPLGLEFTNSTHHSTEPRRNAHPTQPSKMAFRWTRTVDSTACFFCRGDDVRQLSIVCNRRHGTWQLNQLPRRHC